MDIRYSRVLKWINTHEKPYLDRWIESVSPNQIESKSWLCDNLRNCKIPKNDNGKVNIEIVGGWFGFPLIENLNNSMDFINKINLYDLDPIACRIARKYKEVFNFKFDIIIHERDYFDQKDMRRAHIVINTSSEHMPSIEPLKEYLISPSNSLMILQSNNMVDEPDHVNCVESVDELVKKSGIKNVMYKGSLPLGNYNRFMVMGMY